MKKSILYILPALMAVVALQSCQDELDAIPNSVVLTENAITDQKSAEIALNGAYYRFANGAEGGTFGSRVDWQPHETTGSLMSGTMYSDYAFPLVTHTIQADYYWGDGIWSHGYQTINAANGVIEGVNNLPDSKFNGSRKNEILAEAKFLRAYGHWMLLGYFGQFFKTNSEYGIALRKNFVTSEMINLPRNSVAETYDHIIEDLDFAIAHAPTTNEPYYATSWAAMLLKARVIINRAAPGDYNEVVSLTENIIANGPFTLEANLKDLFATKGLTSTEVILGIKPKTNQDYKESYYLFHFVWQRSAYMDSLLKNDPRNDWMIGDMIAWWGDTIPAITKYVGLHHEVSYAFRLTEAYLLQAEALVRSGGDITKAKDRLKTVMTNAGITDFTTVDGADSEILTMLIFQETAKNLCYEDGQEWFALLRFPQAVIQTQHPAITKQEQYILPIPKMEMDGNPNMIQNPGY